MATKEERSEERREDAEQRLEEAAIGAKGCLLTLAAIVAISLLVWGCSSLVGVVTSDDPPATTAAAPRAATPAPGPVSFSAVELADAEPSPGCLQAVRAKDAGVVDADDEEFAALSRATLVECETALDWMAATRQHPRSVMLAEPRWVDDQTLAMTCFYDPDTPVCRDAVQLGITLGP